VEKCSDFDLLYFIIYCWWKLRFLHKLFFGDFKSFFWGQQAHFLFSLETCFGVFK
jgi:hypothetical protein